MKSVFIKLLFSVLCLGFSNTILAQQTELKTIQPKIIVIPNLKSGEDLRAKIENDINYRIALTKIKEAFDSRGFTTIDAIAKIKAIGTNAALSQDTQTDLKSEIIRSSSADIYVDAEIDIQQTSSGNSVNFILTAYEVSSGNSLSNKVGESGKFYTEDYSKLTSKAIESIADDFLNVMQTKFDLIVKDGRTIMLNISIDKESTYTFDTEIGEESLGEKIENWIADNSYKNNYAFPNISEYLMVFDQVKIPLFEQNGRNYSPNKFSKSLENYLKTYGIKLKTTYLGNTQNVIIH
ncbi:DUF6175 family protein [Algoriella xinjiangensis]|nr:DUF6175 family protein [Algoriella xinjiangensis]